MMRMLTMAMSVVWSFMRATPPYTSSKGHSMEIIQPVRCMGAQEALSATVLERLEALIADEQAVAWVHG